jgi:cyclin-dependent kinase regulatory subunit CKS1
MPHFPDETEYSDKYSDDFYEYRHVLLTRNIYKRIPRDRLLSEQEWRAIGVQ